MLHFIKKKIRDKNPNTPTHTHTLYTHQTTEFDYQNSYFYLVYRRLNSSDCLRGGRLIYEEAKCILWLLTELLLLYTQMGFALTISPVIRLCYYVYVVLYASLSVAVA